MTDIQSSDTQTTPADLSRAIDNLEKNLDSISRSNVLGVQLFWEVLLFFF